MAQTRKEVAKSTVRDIWEYIKCRINETTAESTVMSIILAGIIMFSRNLMLNWNKPEVVVVDRSILNWYFFIFFAILAFKLARKILVAYFARRSQIDNDRRALRNQQLALQIQEQEMHLIEIKEQVKKLVSQAIHAQTAESNKPEAISSE